MCDECDTKLSPAAIGYCDDERMLCDNCFNSAIAKAENAWDMSRGK